MCVPIKMNCCNCITGWFWRALVFLSDRFKMLHNSYSLYTCSQWMPIILAHSAYALPVHLFDTVLVSYTGNINNNH